jgi:hypothetical protein
MGCLEGSGVPVLYIGHTVPEGLISGTKGVSIYEHFGLRTASRNELNS